MLRSLIAGLGVVVVLFMVGLAVAEEYSGKVKTVKDDKITITVKDGDKDKDVDVMLSKETKYKKGKKDGVAGDVKEGSIVKVSTEKKDGKEVATSVNVGKGK